MKMKAITLVDRALRQFEAQSGMTPRVILLPRRVYCQFEAESRLLEDVLPPVTIGRRERDEWADVRVVEHEAIEEVEVY